MNVKLLDALDGMFIPTSQFDVPKDWKAYLLKLNTKSANGEYLLSKSTRKLRNWSSFLSLPIAYGDKKVSDFFFTENYPDVGIVMSFERSSSVVIVSELERGDVVSVFEFIGHLL